MSFVCLMFVANRVYKTYIMEKRKPI